jgi:hypothetical protein
MEIAAIHGHRVTYDWTQDVEQIGDDGNIDTDPQRRAHLAGLDVEGVRAADLLVLLPYDGWTGALIECGIAIERDIDIFLVGDPPRDSIFFDLHMVRRVDPEDLDMELDTYGVFGHDSHLDIPTPPYQ